LCFPFIIKVIKKLDKGSQDIMYFDPLASTLLEYIEPPKEPSYFPQLNRPRLFVFPTDEEIQSYFIKSLIERNKADLEKASHKL